MIAILSLIISILAIAIVLLYIFYRQRKQILENLRNSEAQMRLLLESVGDGVFGVDLDGNCTFINPSALRILGFNSAQDVEGKNIHSKIHHTQRNGSPCPDEQCNIYRAFRENQCFHIDSEILWRVDGTHFDVEYRSNPIVVNGKVTGSVASFSDITERKQAEEALRISEEKYRRIFESILDVYAEIGLDGTILEVSPSAQSQTGYPRVELLGKNMSSFYATPSDREKLLEQIYRNGQINDYETLMVDKDGNEHFYSYTGKIIMDANGKPLKLAGVMRDIAERKQSETTRKLAEGTLRKAHDELERYRNHLEELVAKRTIDLEASNKELETFSYSIAHDLRTPLRAITSFSQILQENINEQLDSENLEILGRIIAAGKNMSQLIDDILELSRITRSNLHFTNVNLSKLANEIIIQLKLSEPNKEVQWNMAKNIMVSGDLQLLNIALQNLIENAWKYTRNTSPALIELGVEKIEGEHAYYIRDNGIGFDMDYQAKLFEPFYRLHSPHEYEGTGIGLATFQRIIQRHGGRVWVKAQKDQGATFYFTLTKMHSKTPPASSTLNKHGELA